MTVATHRLRAAACGAIAVVLLVRPQHAHAQQAAPAPAPVPAATPAPASAQRPNARVGIVPLDVEVVISRYQGDKKIASLPYVLSVSAMPGSAGPETLLNMGSDVAIPSGPVPAGDLAAAPRSFTYRPIGSVISLRATVLDDGRFELVLSIDDSSVSTIDRSATPAAMDMPVMRTFKTRNTLLLRDGQQRQFTAATDRISGEVVKIDVTARAVK